MGARLDDDGDWDGHGSGDSDHLDLFKDPDGFYQQEKPATSTSFTLKDGRAISLRLVGHSPLWGHLLWNAGQVITTFLEDNASRYIRHKTILELGAGAGLPSLASAALGARTVIVTDYPEPELITNLDYNIKNCGLNVDDTHIVSLGYLWGQPVDKLKAYLPPEANGFDLVILADVLFNHSEHEKLVTTLSATMSRASDASALVFFTPYRPWLFEKDIAFFDLARARGFVVTKVMERVMEKVMFDDDPGDELLRRTVFGYQLAWSRP